MMDGNKNSPKSQKHKEEKRDVRFIPNYNWSFESKNWQTRKEPKRNCINNNFLWKIETKGQ